MGEREELDRLQRLLAQALTSQDPAAFLQGASELRDTVAGIDRIGLRIASLLVAKLRFERLMNGSASANEWWQRDAAGFTAAFRRYHREVPPTGTDPWAEAALFEAWVG